MLIDVWSEIETCIIKKRWRQTKLNSKQSRLPYIKLKSNHLVWFNRRFWDHIHEEELKLIYLRKTRAF